MLSVIVMLLVPFALGFWLLVFEAPNRLNRARFGVLPYQNSRNAELARASAMAASSVPYPQAVSEAHLAIPAALCGPESHWSIAIPRFSPRSTGTRVFNMAVRTVKLQRLYLVNN